MEKDVVLFPLTHLSISSHTYTAMLRSMSQNLQIVSYNLNFVHPDKKQSSYNNYRNESENFDDDEKLDTTRFEAENIRLFKKYTNQSKGVEYKYMPQYGTPAGINR